MTTEAIRAGIEAVAGVPGRFETIDAGQPFTVIVDYAHTPDSLENVIRTARGLGDGRLTVVFGAGGDRDRSKRPEMGRVVSELADRTILTSDNPRSEDPEAIAAEVASGATGSFEQELDRRAAIELALTEAAPGRDRRDRGQRRRARAGARRRARCRSTTARSPARRCAG